jgi:lipoprotein-anchoring transpeptidase ErfK/SrfK
MLVVGLVVLSLAQAANVEAVAVSASVDDLKVTESLAVLDVENAEWIEDGVTASPRASMEAFSAFDLQAELNLLRLSRPSSEPPANPPAVQVTTVSAAPANSPTASHLTRAGWPKTTAETTLAPRVKNPPTQGKWIDVNITRQTVTAYFGPRPIKTVLTSTGTWRHPTVIGTYRVYAKIPSQTMTGGSRARGDYYRLPGVPNIMYFYQGYGLHGTYWHRNFGHPMSHGCVNLTLADAAWFYAWTPMSTIVRTHY